MQALQSNPGKNSLMSPHFYDLVTKSAIFLDLLSLIGAFTIAGNHLGNGAYEVSIYQAYPCLFWILIFTTIIFGQLAIWIEIISRNNTYGWVYPLALIILANTLVLSLPYLRHYAFSSQWDDVNHFANTMSILDYGHPDLNNFYPASHLLAASFSLFTGINLQKTLLLFSPIFYLVYTANMTFAAWTIDDRPGVRGFILSLSLPLGYNTFSSIFRPTHFSVYMLPLLLAWLYKTRIYKGSWLDSIPLLLILLYFPFLHPCAVLTSALLFISFILGSVITNSDVCPVRQKGLTSPVGILVITWVTWFTSFEIFAPSLRRVLNSFIQAITGSHSFADYITKAQRVHLLLGKIFSLIVYTYGPTVLYLAIAGGVVIWVIVRLTRYRKQNFIDTFALSIFTIGLSAIAVITLFRDMISEGPLRFTNFVFAFVPLLAGKLYYDHLLLHHKYSSKLLDRNTSASILLFVVLIVTSIIGISSTYYSPLTGQPNQQFSFAQQVGIKFLLEKSDQDNKNIYSPFGGAFTLSSVLNSVDLAQLRQAQPRWWVQVAPDHFSDQSTKDPRFEYPGYLFVTAPEKAYYTQVWPSGGRITPEDFQNLSKDDNWHQIYQSGDITIWRRATK